MCTDAATASSISFLNDLKIGYSNVWEDHALLETALDVQADDDVLSVTSAGDNVLNLLLKEPHSLTAIDMNKAQIAVLELKMAAIRHLPSHQDLLMILGLQGTQEERVAVYNSLKPRLPPSCFAYFDSNSSVVEEGLVSSGMLEKMIASYHRDILPKVVSTSQINALFDATSVQEQAQIFRSFPLEKMKQTFLEFFAFDKLIKGRSEKQKENVWDLNLSENLWSHLTHIVTTIPIQKNFYLSWLLRGPAVAHHTVSPYLEEKNFNRLRSLVDRVTVVTESLENHLQHCNHHTSYSKINLSDVFEFKSKEDSDALLHLAVANCRSGGRLAYWDLFVPHPAPETLLKSQLLRPISEMESQFYKEDRLWWYIYFHVYEVKNQSV